LSEGVTVVRPLLDVRRAEVMEYLHEIGQTAQHDASNDDVRLTRNRIRHELLPHLTERFNKNIVERLTKLAEQADDLFRDQEIEVSELLEKAEKPRAGDWVVLDRDVLEAMSRDRVRSLFRLLWDREGWPVGRMSFDHWDRLAEVSSQASGAQEYPAGVVIRTRDRVVLLRRDVTDPTP
jgi:tRNA(Ile)-lysidine synthase